ncbi:MAG: phosphoenolpyruvate synthase [Acidobacteriota bacterium]
MTERTRSFVLWLDEVSLDDVPLVGGKSASMGQMTRLLEGSNVTVPPGFAVTTAAFIRILEGSPDVRQKIVEILSEIDYDDYESLFRGAKLCRELVRDLGVPAEVREAIGTAYEELERRSGISKVDVAVRSSAIAEDSMEASFAGQHESFLGIRGRRNVLESCRNCFASLFTNRAVDYRHRQEVAADDFNFAVTVQQMARSEKACSGTLFTLDPESGARDSILLNSSWGLGELVVQGQVRPDHFLVFKPTLRRGPDYDPVIARRLGLKERKMVYSWGGTEETEILETPPSERSTFTLDHQEVIELTHAACDLEEAYGYPLDIEWAKDGFSGALFFVQARPVTVHREEAVTSIERYSLREEGRILTSGQAVGSRVAVGAARVIHDIHGIDAFHDGEVLVTERTDPDWEPAMKRAAAIVTDTGGRTSHAAIVARELGILCVVGTGDGTEVIPDDSDVTVSCVEEEGRIYEGRLAFDHEVIDLEQLPETETDVMLIVGNPAQAPQQARLPSKGVGLARLEFIIASEIGVHPRALLEMERLSEEELKELEAKIVGYETPSDYYVERLARGVARIAAAFYPKDVIVRLTDFKSNEYRGLLGGRHFEPREENPMLGWRGACRYTHPDYREAFHLECEALRRARNRMGLDNIKIMVPFCRTVDELRATLEVMESFGLKRGESGLELYMMVEIPSNVLLLRSFAPFLDGISIGSNDLTQLALGLDRDAGGSLAGIADERNEAVQMLLRMTLRTVQELAEEGTRLKAGICGQAPSDFPEVTRLLVEEKIDSISVTPDALVPTILTVADCERG